MPFTNFTNLDFDQIKKSIKDYLRANSNFTDFDFEGSNFSVLLNALAYNTYISSFNANMIVNESYLDSAIIRENVTSLARNIGYIPRSRSAAKALISFSVPTNTSSPTLTLQAGLAVVGSNDNTSYIFSIPENITTTVSGGFANFNDITVYQGTYLSNTFVVDGSLDQKFLISNSFVDTSTLVVNIKGPSDTGLGNQFYPIDNLVEVNENSQIYFIQEVNDEQYEILFGDGIFGKKLENNSIITLSYIVTDGTDGNGASNFSFSGRLIGSSSEIVIPSGSVSINTSQNAQNGADIESTTSIKYYAPRLYSSQYRAVTSSDYETLIKQIYPNAESVSITGGEELTPPQFGNVFISIKPQNGTYLSEFNKEQILSKLKKYSVSGIKQSIVDLKLLYVEINSSVYYNSSRVSTVDSLRTSVMNSLSSYASSIDLNTFGGRFKYSKVLHVIDNTDAAITSNITKVIIRRDLNAVINQFIQYELCFGNKFHINSAGHNIKSTAFKISSVPDTVYLTDIPNKDANGNLDGSNTGYISIIKLSSSVDGYDTVIKNAGTVDYKKGEIILNTINILSTETKDSTIQIQANPESNDIVGLRELYLYFDVSKSVINMTRDVIASGDEISGTVFVRDFYTSSYSNGALIRTAI